MDNIMWKHIYEQTDTLKELLYNEQIIEFSKIVPIHQLEKLVFVAFGSSYNCAFATKRLFEELTGIETVVYTPFDFIGENPLHRFNASHTLVVGISQTGTSSGTAQSLKLAKEEGFSVLSITERRRTPVAEIGDYYLNFLSGEEPCNAKTKGFSHSLVLLMLIAIHFAKEKGTINDDQFSIHMKEIEESIEDIPDTIERTKKWIENNPEWSNIGNFLVIGYGQNFPIALEGQLKLIETLCVPGSICELGEFSHGFHRTIGPNLNVITLQTEGYGKEVMSITNEYLKLNSGKLLTISTLEDYAEDDNTISVPYRPLTASCINLAVVFQVLAAGLPELKGEDPNAPKNEDYPKLVGTR